MSDEDIKKQMEIIESLDDDDYYKFISDGKSDLHKLMIWAIGILDELDCKNIAHRNISLLVAWRVIKVMSEETKKIKSLFPQMGNEVH